MKWVYVCILILILICIGCIYLTLNNTIESFTNAKEGERNVFLYWVGNTPHLVALLRDIIVKHSNGGAAYHIHLINDDNIREYVDELPDCFKELVPAHQADYVRVYCIWKYGGIWLDSDTLVMNDLSTLFNKMNTHDGFFVTEESKISNGIFGSKPKTTLMKEWLDAIQKTLAEKKCKNIEWTEIGNTYLTHARDSGKLANYEIMDGAKTIYPVIHYNAVQDFIEKPYDHYKEIEREYQPVIILVNAVYKKIDTMVKSKDEIKNLNIPLAYFINKSLNTSVPTSLKLSYIPKGV